MAAGAAEGSPPSRPLPMPRHIFVVALAWMLLLIAAFFVWVNMAEFRDLLPDELGPLPVETIWFGAVGGMLVSMGGIYRHNAEWDHSYDYWHYTRPLLGAFIGVLGCLTFIVLTEASTRTPIEANPTFYSVIALVIGYREESFRTLVTRVTDMIVLPSAPRPASRGTEQARTR